MSHAGAASLIALVSILFGSCSTIVKGTEQQVSVNTPGVPGAMCQLQSPGIGTRTCKRLQMWSCPRAGIASPFPAALNALARGWELSVLILKS
jgi:hypothetical protein